MELLEYIFIIISSMSVLVVALFTARRLSERIEESAEKTTRLREEIEMLHGKLEAANDLIEKKDRELESLKSELQEREQYIADMHKRLDFAEKVSERDTDRIRMMMTDLDHTLKELKERIKAIERATDRRVD